MISNLNVQNMVTISTYFQFWTKVHSNIYQIKKNQSFLSFLCPEIFDREIMQFFEAWVLLTVPTVPYLNILKNAYFGQNDPGC